MKYLYLIENNNMLNEAFTFFDTNDKLEDFILSDQIKIKIKPKYKLGDTVYMVSNAMDVMVNEIKYKLSYDDENMINRYSNEYQIELKVNEIAYYIDDKYEEYNWFYEVCDKKENNGYVWVVENALEKIHRGQ